MAIFSKIGLKNIILKTVATGIRITRNQNADATIKLPPFKLHRLDKGPSTEAKVTSSDALIYYRKMKMIREMETSAANLYREKSVRGFCHLYAGQEACIVGMRAAMRSQDNIITSYRAHGATYVMGASVLQVLAELTGRSSGCVRGKGGSMHMYWKHMYGGNGIVGAQVPLGIGLAFAGKYLKNDAVTFTLYGEGAANQGQVFESFNLAKLLELPVVFVCENNLYGMGTPAERATTSTQFYTRGDFIPGLWADGQDVIEVREACKYSIEYARTKGPILLELHTYRYYGHSLSDPGTSYRSREEVQEVRKTRDPIAMFKDLMVANKLATEAEIKTIDAECKKEVNEAYKKSKTDPEVDIKEMAADVYSNPIDLDVRGVHPWQVYKHIRVGKTLNI